MTEFELEELLKEFQERELAGTPAQYNRDEARYGKCPPLWRYRQAAATNGWQPMERQHIRRCPYCQKSIAMQWSFGCPSPEAIQAPGFEEAKRIHLEQHECKACRRALQVVPSRPTWLPTLIGLVGQQDAGESAPWYFQEKFGSPEFEVNLWLEGRTLKLRVQTTEQNIGGRKVAVRLRLKDGEVLDHLLELEDRGEFGSLKEISIDHIDLARLEESRIQAEWT
jgi:hypothetical protein